MNTLLVGYDLKAPGKDYEGLYVAIKLQGTAWWHHLDSTWLIRTDKSVSQVRDALKEHLDQNDELLVINVTGCARSWSGFNKRGGDWLRNVFS